MAAKKVKKPAAPQPPPEPASPHLVGYARVSMADQNPQMQIDALMNAGVHKDDVFWEHNSGTGVAKRRELPAMMKQLQPGDVVIVWKLDRLGRNAAQLYDLSRQIQDKNANLRVLTTPGLDTTTPMGRAMFGMLAVFAEFEASVGKERTIAGLRRAAAGCVRGPEGPRRALSPHGPGCVPVRLAWRATRRQPPCVLMRLPSISPAKLSQ